MADAEAVAARISTEDAPLGTIGPRFNWRSPFLIGMTATVGVAVTVALIWLLLQAGSVLVLIGLSLFLAIGMEPAVSWLVRHRFPRWAAVMHSAAGHSACRGRVLVAAGAALVSQGEELAAQIPSYLQEAQDNNPSSAGSTISSGCRRSCSRS